MNRKRALLMVAALLSLPVAMQPAEAAQAAAAAETGKPVKIYRFFTGSDGLTYAEEIEVKFANGAFDLLKTSGAVLRRSPPGRVNDWHPASKRQYVITLSGHGELVLSGGQTLKVGPGDIELAEDTTGKGHITKTVGTEDRVSIAIPLIDQK